MSARLGQRLQSELGDSSALERSVLEAASVAGHEFSTAAVAAAVMKDTVQVEELCMRWARRARFSRSKKRAEWKDGTLAEHFEFIHVLYQDVIYAQIGAARRAQLHRRMGERYADEANIIRGGAGFLRGACTAGCELGEAFLKLAEAQRGRGAIHRSESPARYRITRCSHIPREVSGFGMPSSSESRESCYSWRRAL